MDDNECAGTIHRSLPSDDPDEIRPWLCAGPSDRDLAKAYAEVHNRVWCLYEEDISDEDTESWELLERQMLHQIARRWLTTQGISWSAGWWIDDGRGEVYEAIDWPETSSGDLIVPFDTPLGGVCLCSDGEPVVPCAFWEPGAEGAYAASHPVDGNWRLAYRHEMDGKRHVVECRLVPTHACESTHATGERLQAVEVTDGVATLIIGVEWDVGSDAYDYVAHTIDNGVSVEIPGHAKGQWLVFGLSWVENTTEENACNPWLMGDPVGDRDHVPRSGVARRCQ